MRCGRNEGAVFGQRNTYKYRARVTLQHRKGENALRTVISAILAALACFTLTQAQTTESSPRSPETTPAKAIVIKAARMFDGRSDRAVSPGLVVVAGEKITAIGAGAALRAGAEVIDLGDATLLPGLIDAHTHLSGEASGDWNRDTLDALKKPIAERALDASVYARRTLLAGFTTVRDVGSSDFIDVGLRNAIRSGKIIGPRMLVSVHAIGATGGHCDDNAGYLFRLFGKETGAGQCLANGPEAVRAAVRLSHKYGADVIKTCATGGGSGKDTTGIPSQAKILFPL